MDYTQFVNELFNNACPSSGPDVEGWFVFHVETHCVSYWVRARKTQLTKQTEGRWEISQMVVDM